MPLFIDALNSLEVSTTPIFFYNPYIVAIFGGVVLSIMGLFLIWVLRPKVIIAPDIAKSEVNGEVRFVFKIINKSYLFQLIDVNFQLTILKPESSPKGMNLAIKKIKLKSNHVWFLSRRKLSKKSSDYATYAILVRPDNYNLLDEWKKYDAAFLNLKVIAKNNFSGITSINHQTYNHTSCIKTGEFCHGNSLKIENGD